MAEILNKCPRCGDTLFYNLIIQKTKGYKIKKDGRISKKVAYNESDIPMDYEFISCASCGFGINTDFEIGDGERVNIFMIDGIFFIEREGE